MPDTPLKPIVRKTPVKTPLRVSAPVKKKRVSHHKKKRGSFAKAVLKVLFWLSVVLVLYFFWSPIKFELFRLLQLNSTIWSIYLSITREITANTLLGLFLTSFFGALFFVSIPVELVFFYYLSLNFSPWEVIAFAALGNILGMMFNYVIGFLLGPKLMEKKLKSKYALWQKRTDKYGGSLLIFGNVVPFPIEVVTLFIGGVRYNFAKFLFYTFLGKIIKFTLLFLGYTYFSEQLSGLWVGSFQPWLLHMYAEYIKPFVGSF